MISYQNDNLTHIDDNFLYYDQYLKSILLPNVESIRNNFLWSDEEIESIYLPSIKNIGENFNFCNENRTIWKLKFIEPNILNNNEETTPEDFLELKTI